ncbi:MAG: endonuclease/exonuclease/phosphatase family protein [Bacteroidales bacterium]|nr:endonuclease/exonuclease/phosphatase family protein [Bacteroidales bacterium]
MVQKKKRHWLSHLSFGSVALIASALLILGYLSVFVDPAKGWFFTLFGLLWPVVFPVSAVLFVWSLFRRSHMRGLLLLALLPSFFILGRYFQFKGPADETPAELKIVSYNVGLFAHGPASFSRTALADSTARYLRSLDADIICLQEFWLPLSQSPDSWIRSHFPGYRYEYYVFVGKKGRFGNVTLSRLPLEGKGKHTFEHSTNLALYTDVQLPGSKLRLYNCHFESYNISLPALVKSDSAVEEAEAKMRRSISERPKQVSQVLGGMDSAPVNSLALGDFNDTPLSYTYFRLIRGRKDSFVKAGKGFGATHRSLWPFLRIDYILFPPELSAASFKVDRVPYSDHYPLIAEYYERHTK